MIHSQHIRARFPSLQRQHRQRPLLFLDGPGGTQAPDMAISAISDYYKTVFF
ncbi:MAG: hypothetical protein JNL51_00685 [Chitinophagaceae bacterium]|nr:hypothetical protein [Chitinophagaceae bacterium]